MSSDTHTVRKVALRRRNAEKERPFGGCCCVVVVFKMSPRWVSLDLKSAYKLPSSEELLVLKCQPDVTFVKDTREP